MALSTVGAALGGIAAGSVGGGYSDSTSINSGLGFGLNSGSSFEQGGGSNWGNESSSSSSWYKQYGAEASAKDIERAAEANAWNEKMIDKNMAFQERMSNTSYQRLVNDLLAAGINPRAIYSGMAAGATTPTGAMTGAAKAQTFPDIESGSESSSSGSSGGSYYNVGGSQQSGININVNSGKTTSKSEPTISRVLKDISKANSSYHKGADGYDMPLNF